MHESTIKIMLESFSNPNTASGINHHVMANLCHEALEYIHRLEEMKIPVKDERIRLG